MRGGLAPAYLAYWGKAQPEDPASPPFHPIAYHALDVAAVMEAVLRARAGAVRRASRLLGVGDEDAIALCTVLASFHDRGDVGILSTLIMPAPMSRVVRSIVRPFPYTFVPSTRGPVASGLGTRGRLSRVERVTRSSCVPGGLAGFSRTAHARAGRPARRELSMRSREREKSR